MVGWFVYYELNMWNKDVVAYFKALSRRLSREDEENNEIYELW
jgi:hypothetical protein